MGPCLSKGTNDNAKADSSEVSIWLNDNGLGEYTAKFKERGWDEISLLLEMTDSQIDTCIQKPGHVVKFKKALESLNRSMGKTRRRGNSQTEGHRRRSSENESISDEASYAKMKERNGSGRRRVRSYDSGSDEDTPYRSGTQAATTNFRADNAKDSGTVNVADNIMPKAAEKYKVSRETKWDSDSSDDTQPNSILHYNSEPKRELKETSVDSILEKDKYPSYLSDITTASKYMTAASSLSDDESLVGHASKDSLDQEDLVYKKPRKARRSS